MKRVIGAVAALLLLTACSDPHKNQHCVRSHEESGFIMTCISYGKYGCSAYMPIPYTNNVCDQWVNNTPNGRENQ